MLIEKRQTKKSAIRNQQSAIAVCFLLIALASPADAGNVVLRFSFDVHDTASGICWIRMSYDGGVTWGKWNDFGDNVCFELHECAGSARTVVCIGNTDRVGNITVETSNCRKGICSIGMFSDVNNNDRRLGIISPDICFELADCAGNINRICATGSGPEPSGCYRILP